MVLGQTYHLDGGKPPAGAWDAEPTPQPPDDFDEGWQDATTPAEAIEKPSAPAPSRVAQLGYKIDWTPVQRKITPGQNITIKRKQKKEEEEEEEEKEKEEKKKKKTKASANWYCTCLNLFVGYTADSVMPERLHEHPRYLKKKKKKRGIYLRSIKYLGQAFQGSVSQPKTLQSCTASNTTPIQAAVFPGSRANHLWCQSSWFSSQYLRQAFHPAVNLPGFRANTSGKRSTSCRSPSVHSAQDGYELQTISTFKR
jgi:hypothetical protein